MKHIFKKLHFGNSSSSSSSHAQDPSRSSNDPSAPTPSCASDHRTTSAQTSGHSPASPSSPSPAASTTPSAVASAPDYFTSEEEFQVQLALAISASNSEFRDGNDPDTDQIRAATLLSLGRLRIDSVGKGEDAAVLLSRRYWVSSKFFLFFPLLDSNYSSSDRELGFMSWVFMGILVMVVYWLISHCDMHLI